MAAERPSPLDVARASCLKLERENAHLRRLDEAMRERLARAVAEADEAKKLVEAQANMLTDLRAQLAKQSLELELARAEIASQPKPAVVTKPDERVAPSRTELLEVD